MRSTSVHPQKYHEAAIKTMNDSHTCSSLKWIVLIFAGLKSSSTGWLGELGPLHDSFLSPKRLVTFPMTCKSEFSPLLCRETEPT